MNGQLLIFPRRTAAQVPAGWLVRMLASALAWMRRQRQTRRNFAILRRLDDQMLADIGILPDQIGYVARRGRLPDWK